GMTRAREELTLSYARRRSVYGQANMNPRSRFIEDIPRELTDTLGSAPASDLAIVRTIRQERSGTYTVVDAPVERQAWVPPFKVGQKVTHKKFGMGVVVACGPLKNDAEVTVAFPGAVGIKKMVQSLAKLEEA
ncbi:MAG: DNA helicase II, partial [Armatimonadota bacterium]